MANWYGVARSNYVELAPGVTQKTLENLFKLLGAQIEVSPSDEKNGTNKVAFFGDDEYGCFPGTVDVELELDNAEDVKGILDLLPDYADEINEAIADGNDYHALDDVEFSWTDFVMPLIKAGEVLVLQEAGAEKQRYVTGWAAAYMRDESGTVKEVSLSIDNIYALARAEFGLGENYPITSATY